MGKKIVAIVGSYRKQGVVGSAIEEILAAAREKGSRTSTIYLTEQHIEFCTNCRRCTQKPGPDRGVCVQNDDLQSILQEIESADALVLGSPVNFGNVTAIFRRFMERLMGTAYWPWGQASPTARNRPGKLRAVLVSSSAMPGAMMVLFTSAAKALKMTAGVLGAKVIGRLWIGMAAKEPDHRLSARQIGRARRLGYRLAG